MTIIIINIGKSYNKHQVSLTSQNKLLPTALIFDCDGVLMDTNNAKSQIFFQIALPYGKDLATELCDFHAENGGVSRIIKINYLLTTLFPKYNVSISEPLESLRNELLLKFTSLSYQSMLEAKVNDHAIELIQKCCPDVCMVISGSDQTELRSVFSARNLSAFFHSGIFGGPRSKEDIFRSRLSTIKSSSYPIFIGDSKLDYRCTLNSGVKFLFSSKWTDVPDWQSWVSANKIPFTDNIYSYFFP